MLWNQPHSGAVDWHFVIVVSWIVIAEGEAKAGGQGGEVWGGDRGWVGEVGAVLVAAVAEGAEVPAVPSSARGAQRAVHQGAKAAGRGARRGSIQQEGEGERKGRGGAVQEGGAAAGVVQPEARVHKGGAGEDAQATHH